MDVKLYFQLKWQCIFVKFTVFPEVKYVLNVKQIDKQRWVEKFIVVFCVVNLANEFEIYDHHK